MPSSQQHVSARRRFPENLTQLLFSSCAAVDTSMQIADPQISKPARQLSPAEREDSIRKRQRPPEVNTLLTIVGACNGNEIAALTDDQNALHTAKGNELLNMDKSGVVEVVDRPQSQQILSTHAGVSKTQTGRIIQSETCGTRISTYGQFRCRFPRWNAKAHDFARTSHDCSDSRKSSCFRRLSQCVSSITQCIRSTAGLFQGMALQDSVSRT